MGASLWVKQGTGHACYICGKKIEKTQKQINFKGWNSSAIIHSNPKDCDVAKR
jgi:hypothetical protein